MTQSQGRTVWRFLKKLGVKFPYNPALLGIYPEKITIQEHIYIQMFTAALFTVVRTWKTPRCPSTE